MVPGPLVASPPLRLQTTFASPPPCRMARNCSACAPWLPLALQPVQLVSMTATPGESEKRSFAGLAVSPSPLHPVTTANAASNARPTQRDNALEQLEAVGNAESELRKKTSKKGQLPS